MLSYLFICRFRWVFCQLEVLRHCLPASIRQTLDQLPESLDETYLRVLSQIPQANQAHAHRMLQCLMVAVRPLRVDELAELLAFEFDATHDGIPKYRAAWQLDDQTQAVLSTCSSLVTIISDKVYNSDPYGLVPRPWRPPPPQYADWSPPSRWSRSDHLLGVVQFSHFSVKEFLMPNRLGIFSRYHIRPTSAHTILTQACLGSLLHFDNHIDRRGAKGFPLLKYAARNWVEHAKFEGVALHVKAGMETLFDSDKPHFAAWMEIDNINDIYGWWLDDLEIFPNPLYCSVLCGFRDLVKHLAIQHPQYVNAECGRYRFPLLAALCENNFEVAELLLEHGADVDVREASGDTMLLMMLRWRQQDLNVVRFLLKHGTDVNVRDGALMSPLHLAMYEGKLEVAQMLLKHKADVNSQNKHDKTPLHIVLERWPRRSDECDVLSYVRLLLEHEAEVDCRDEDNETPLHLVVGHNWFNLGQILLERGADADAENNNGKTPLHMLLERWRYSEDDVLDYVQLLFEHGAGVNRRNKRDETPLHLALAMGQNWFNLVQILLERGADANAENQNGKTPLHILLERWRYSEDAVLCHALLLLEHGAEVNKRDKDYQAPLHLAMRLDWYKLVKILLEHGADASAAIINMERPRCTYCWNAGSTAKTLFSITRGYY